MKKIGRRGVTLVDSLCGLFLISLGLSFYFETNQMIDQGLYASQQKLIQVRHEYEQRVVNRENEK